MRSVDTTMVQSYWQIGRYIVEEEQGGAKRAVYGKELLKTMSSRLGRERASGIVVFVYSQQCFVLY